MNKMNKLKLHLFTLPRWFALPFFGASIALGIILAGGSFLTLYPYLALLTGLLIMGGGHSFNSFLDYSWTGLDKGEPEDRSAEKSYTGGQNVIARGLCSPTEVLANACGWYLLALVPGTVLALQVSPWMFLIMALMMSITFWYSWAKFNWTHELSLAVGAGPLSVLIGMFGVNPHPEVIEGIIVGFPVAIILSFAGLALDEYPDAEANLKKGVKSIAYKVWQYKVDLSSYLAWWIIILYCYQVFMVSIGIFYPLTGITFLLTPILMALLVMLKGQFEKTAPWFVIVAALYPVLLVVGQAFGGR